MEDSSLKSNGSERSVVLKSYGLIEAGKDLRFHEITLLASQICEVPVAAFNVIDDDSQNFKARIGFSTEKLPITPSFCAQVVQTKAPLIIEDLSGADESFKKNLPECLLPLKFYAAFPLTLPNGFVIGTLLLADTKARTLTELQKSGLHSLGRQIVYHCQKDFDLLALKMRTRAVIHDVNNHAAIVSGSSYFLKDASTKPQINPQQISNNADRIQSAIHKIVHSVKNLRNVIIS